MLLFLARSMFKLKVLKFEFVNVISKITNTRLRSSRPKSEQDSGAYIHCMHKNPGGIFGSSLSDLEYRESVVGERCSSAATVGTARCLILVDSS